MNKLLNLAAILALLICAHTSGAQNLKTDSLFNWGKSGWELTADMVSDIEGNFYLCGSFSGEIAIGTTLLKSNGKRDIFLAKFSPDNQLVWAKNLGGAADDNAYSLLYAGDKLYLAGSFRKEISFNNGSIQLNGKGLTDVFLAQLAPDGSLAWAKAITSHAPAQKAFLHAGHAGNIYLAGSFSKPVECSGIQISQGDQKGIYYASFSPSGNLEKSGYFNGLATISLNGFLLTQNGNMCFAGSFTESLQIDGKSLLSHGKTDGFIACLDGEGKALWLKNPGGAFDDEIKCLGQDSQGNLYTAGDFKYNFHAGKEFTAPQNTDVFLIKYTPEGEMAWAVQLGEQSQSYNTVTSIEVAADGRFFLSGAFRGKLQDSPLVKSLGNSKNAFIARYDTHGKRDWVLGTESSNENRLWMKLHPNSGGLFVSGYFSEGFKLGDFELRNKNYKDIFFGKLVDCDLAPKVKLGPDTTVCQGIEIQAKGNFTSYLWSNNQNTQTIKPGISGRYHVQATDKHGCISFDTVMIQLLPAPEFDLGEDKAICEGQNQLVEAPQGFAAYQWENGTAHVQRMLAQAGKYWLRVTDSLGCSFTDTLALTVNPLPEFDLGPDRVLAANESLELEPMLEPGDYKYLWSNGSTGKTLHLQESSLQKPENIVLTVTDQNLCSYTGMVKVQSHKFTLTEQDLTGGQGYKIYPNPSKGKFYISIPDPSKVKQIDIYDVRGNLVKSYQNIPRLPLEVDLNRFSKGQYLVKIHDKNILNELKVIIE